MTQAISVHNEAGRSEAAYPDPDIISQKVTEETEREKTTPFPSKLEVERLDPKALVRSGFAATRWG
jgi:hypothetical protein